MKLKMVDVEYDSFSGFSKPIFEDENGNRYRFDFLWEGENFASRLYNKIEFIVRPFLGKYLEEKKFRITWERMCNIHNYIPKVIDGEVVSQNDYYLNIQMRKNKYRFEKIQSPRSSVVEHPIPEGR